MKAWPVVPLRSVLRTYIDAVPSNQLDTVNLAGVYGFGRGLFQRGPISPLDTTYKSFHRLNAGDFVISSPKAWEGAVARIPEEFDGWFLSSVFPTFRANSEALDTRFLDWYCKRDAVWRQLQGKAKGMGARRESVSPDQFLSLEIPLPPLPEQQALVARLDALAEKTRQVEAHLEAAERDAERLLRAYIFHPPGEQPAKRPMSELVSQRQPDVIVDRTAQYRFAGVYSFGRGVFPSVVKTGSEFAYERLSTVRAGDFTYPKLMAWEGALGVVPPECDGMVVSPEFPVFSINTDEVLPELLDIYFRTPEVWPELAELSGGTNVRRRRLQPSAFLTYEIPVPSMATQLKLREVFRRTQALKAKHAAIRQANAALLPATLERLFAGSA
ncbi:type I restriction enzyme, S subunit [Methylococcus capsulatus]|jgi:type I restriction enzyme S subunit|uniref:Type I restriction enzyme, S subunit n=1 Tax=Methylococcus capsulatus TaxID=414 RepID=A0AA35Y0U8_METCP|nr:restriction endonuclease subunit S [Methylococcus capsulatus]CAI8816535.1 type I restriction enzyme, S subunit [Methylococcus capsulatus]